jgi:hypothetical protein
MERNYQTSVTPLDYGQTEAARQTINRWVEDKTKDYPGQEHGQVPFPGPDRESQAVKPTLKSGRGSA